MTKSYLDAAWGKFRGWQRVQPASERLTKPQLRAAWRVWDLMRKTEAAALSGDEGWAERIHAQTIELTKAMVPDLRKGPSVFAHYLVEHRDSLERSLERTVAESSHTTDSVTAQIIR